MVSNLTWMMSQWQLMKTYISTKDYVVDPACCWRQRGSSGDALIHTIMLLCTYNRIPQRTTQLRQQKSDIAGAYWTIWGIPMIVSSFLSDNWMNEQEYQWGTKPEYPECSHLFYYYSSITWKCSSSVYRNLGKMTLATASQKPDLLMRVRLESVFTLHMQSDWSESNCITH